MYTSVLVFNATIASHANDEQVVPQSLTVPIHISDPSDETVREIQLELFHSEGRVAR